MGKLILVHEFVLRSAGRSRGNYGAQFRIVLESEEHRLDVGVLDADVDHSVVLFVFAGELVLFDYAGGVIVRVGAKHQAVLGTFAHGLCIHIILFFVFTYQPAVLLPGFEILHSLVIGALLMLACDGLEVNLWLGDVKERLGACHLAGFLGIKNIIRGCSDLGHNIFGRSESCKGFYSYHWVINFISPRYE